MKVLPAVGFNLGTWFSQLIFTILSLQVLILSLALIQCQSFPFDPQMGPPGMDGPEMDGPGMDGCQLICCNPRYLNSIYDLYDDSQEADNPLESLCQKCECDGDESAFEYPDEFPEMPEFPDMPEFPEGPEDPEVPGEYDASEEYDYSEEYYEESLESAEPEDPQEPEESEEIEDSGESEDMADMN